MSPLLVVQNNYVTRVTAPAASAARSLGIDVYDLSVDGELMKRPPLPKSGEWSPILLMGSPFFLSDWAQRFRVLSPWVFWNDKEFDASRWAERLGPIFLNADGYATSVGEFISSGSGVQHVRPRSALKLLSSSDDRADVGVVPGGLMSPAQLRELNVSLSVPIWVSRPVSILAEARVWMIGGRPAAVTLYRLNGEPFRDTEHPLAREALATADQIGELFAPDRHYVVDLALVDHGWRALEFNPIHGCGWYAADPADVLRAFFADESRRDRHPRIAG